MKKVLILLENESQYKEFLKYKKDYGDFLVVICALTPFAIHLCERENIPFVFPENCFTEEEYYRHREISEGKVKKLVSLLNQYSSAMTQKKIGFSLELGNYFYFCLYTVIGALHFKSFILTSVIEKEKPETVIVFKSKVDSIVSFAFLQSYQESSYFKLLSHSIYKDKCRFIDYEGEGKNNVRSFSLKKNIKKIAKAIINKISLLGNLYYFWNNKVSINQVIKGSFSRNKKRVFLLGSLYNWKYVVSHPSFKEHISIWGFDGNEIVNPKRVVKRNIFWEWLKWENKFLGFNLTPLIYRQENIIELTLTKMINSFTKYKEMLNKRDMVLGSVFPFPQQNYIAHIANSIGKPVVIYQHGEKNFAPSALYLEVTELLYTDYYLSYGNAVNSQFLQYQGKFKNFKKTVSVGSVTLDKISSYNKEVKEEYILYATGKYLLNNIPFTNNIGTDIKLYEAQKKILSFLEMLVSQYPFYKVIWKLNHTPTPAYASVPFKVSNIDVIYSEKSLPELIHNASLVILDAPATTCLEVCSTTKPLFVLLNRIKWFPQAQVLLKKRAVTASDPDELVKKISEYLKTGKYEADLKNPDFIKAYGNYLGDGKSVQRTIEFIYSIFDREDTNLRKFNSEINLEKNLNEISA
jgi:hypothetical protein